MKLSVMITTYNLKAFIAETLDSVLEQKVDFSYEILVGDDGSDDGTIDIVREYEKQHKDKLRLFIMDRQPGKKYNRIERASKNRINLLRHAGGEYLIFLDGDDVYTDCHKLQKQVDTLEAPENRNCVACAHNIWLYWNEEKKELINPYQKQFKVDGKDYWRDGMYFHSDTVMFRNVFKGKFPEKINPAYFDDNIIVYSLLEYGKLLYLPEAMANYRQIENSSWNSVDALEKHLINLIDWDIEMQINPAYEKESVIRHFYNILSVWRGRKGIPAEIREKYLEQITRDGLVLSEQWLLYEEQNFGKRCRMTLWLIKYFLIFAVNKIKKTVSMKAYC